MSTVWNYTNGCYKQYICDLYIYLITVLSSSNVIIMDRKVNAPVHVNNFLGGLNSMGKRYLKEQKELIGKLASNNTSNIVMISGASKNIPF